MDQEKTSAAGGIKLIRERGLTHPPRYPLTFILDLPDQPVGREDATDPEPLGGVFRVAVTNGIDQCLVQTELNALACHQASDRFDQKLHQRCQLKRGGQNEIGPPERRNRRDRIARRRNEG